MLFNSRFTSPTQRNRLRAASVLSDSLPTQTSSNPHAVLIWLQIIIRAYREACALAIKKLDSISVHLNNNEPGKRREMLEKSAATSLSSKLVSGHKDFFAKMVIILIHRPMTASF